ncbi:MAG: VWA domain-containing protein, partial [Deltaproteobacteria bacterium]|nr:VWA domain-containing protein [Deltaproteobacteria bacterium]
MSIDPPRPPSHPCRPFRAAPRRCAAVVLGAAALLAAAILPRAALAAPEAHILRIDPRAAMVDGAPVLTTVLELVQNKRYTAITGECGALPENDQLDCIADRLEQPQALYMPLAFPEKAALLTVTVEDVDMPATFVSRGRWGESKSADGVGTAWLLAIDAAASMGPRFPEAKAVARAFVDSMDPQDIVDVMFFNDRAIVSDSEWVSSKATAAAFIDGVPRPYLAQGRTRNLSKIIQTAATNAFRELGNVGSRVKVPMHQAMVLLSNGASGADPSSAAPAAEILKQYLTKGRFPEDNKTLPKAPVPVVSIWFPRRELEELYENARSFMENLANHEIGGFFSIVRDGQSARAPRIAKAVRTRFDQMHIVKWRVSCVAPSLNQTFKLLFRQTDPPIAGDMFENVPTGIDPTTWPLDIDVAATNAYTKKNPIYPGGTVKVFGNFCWGGNKSRAELYMIPKNQPAPQTLQGSSVEDAQKAQKQLIQSNMRGKAVEASDTYAEFEAPDSTKFLSGKGKKMTARLIVYDSRAHRASAITADKILTLPAEE